MRGAVGRAQPELRHGAQRSGPRAEPRGGARGRRSGRDSAPRGGTHRITRRRGHRSDAYRAAWLRSCSGGTGPACHKWGRAMNQFWNLVFSGLVTGAIYSIMASGLVLTYTTSGIFNFAHGAVAFTTAYLFYQLNTGLHVPIVPSLIISVFIFAPLLGLLLDRLLLRRLAKAPVYARIVGTIGLLVALHGLVHGIVDSWVVNVLGWDRPGSQAVQQGAPVPGIGPTPPHVYHPLSGVTLTSDKLAVFIVAGIAAILLWAVLRHSRVG